MKCFGFWSARSVFFFLIYSLDVECWRNQRNCWRGSVNEKTIIKGIKTICRGFKTETGRQTVRDKVGKQIKGRQNKKEKKKERKEIGKDRNQGQTNKQTHSRSSQISALQKHNKRQINNRNTADSRSTSFPLRRFFVSHFDPESRLDGTRNFFVDTIHFLLSQRPRGVSVNEAVAMTRPLRFWVLEDVDQLDLLQQLVGVDGTRQVIKVVRIVALGGNGVGEKDGREGC